jgi:STIMATE family
VAIVTAIHLKWVFEKPRRDYITFGMDGTKQGFSFVIIHFFNIWASSALFDGLNECTWYVIFLIVDTTAGTLMNYSLLICFEWISEKEPSLTFQSGFYEKNHEIRSYVWQLFLWCIIVLANKFTLLLVLYFTLDGLIKASKPLSFLIPGSGDHFASFQ